MNFEFCKKCLPIELNSICINLFCDKSSYNEGEMAKITSVNLSQIVTGPQAHEHFFLVLFVLFDVTL